MRGLVLNLELAVGQGGVDEAVADHFAHGRFRGVFDHSGLIRHVKQIFHGILYLILNAELHIDDVLVPGEHRGLFGQRAVSPLLEGPALPNRAETHLHALHLRHFGLVDRLYGERQGVMRPGADRAVVFAEAQDHPFLIRIDDIDAGKQPHRDEREKYPFDLAALGRGEMGNTFQGIGKLVVVRPFAAALRGRFVIIVV